MSIPERPPSSGSPVWFSKSATAIVMRASPESVAIVDVASR
jgi:hypothetical protein